MGKKFKNKYRIGSNRMPGWDYSGNGIYFLTIVTQDRKHWLGEIRNNEMILSEWGKIIQHEFLKSFEIRSELFLDEYIIMPNHIHMVVRIKNISDSCPIQSDDTIRVQTDGRPSLSPEFYRKPKSISSFMAGFKSSVNSKIDDDIDEKGLNIPKFNRNNHFFQLDYHDRVIRNQGEYMRIVNYIRMNPRNWKTDELTN